MAQFEAVGESTRALSLSLSLALSLSRSLVSHSSLYRLRACCVLPRP